MANTYKPIVPSRPVAPSIPVPPIIPVLPNRPTAPKIVDYSKQRTNSVSPFSDYNSKTQINSLADIIMGNLPNSKVNLDRRDYGFVSDVVDAKIPIISSNLQRTLDTIDLVRNVAIEPIKQGNYKALGINALVNVGESMDILANPIKGLIIDGPEGFTNAAIGRKNYDFDTGNWLTDIVAEVFVDPFNWISFGASGVMKGAAKSGSKTILDSALVATKAAGKEILRDGVDDVAADAAIKQIIKVAQNTMKKGSDDIIGSILTGIKVVGKDKFSDEFIDAITTQQLKALSESQMTYLRIAKGLSHIADVSEDIEKVLFKGSLATSLIPIKEFRTLIKNNPAWKGMGEYIARASREQMQVISGIEDIGHVRNYYKGEQAAKVAYTNIREKLKELGMQGLGDLDYNEFCFESSLKNTTDITDVAARASELTYRDYITELTKVILDEKSVEDILKQPNPGRALLDDLDNTITIIKQVNAERNGMFNIVENSSVRVRRELADKLMYKRIEAENAEALQKLISGDALLTKKLVDDMVAYSPDLEGYYKNYNKFYTKYLKLSVEYGNTFKKLIYSNNPKLITDSIQKYSDYLKRLLEESLGKDLLEPTDKLNLAIKHSLRVLASVNSGRDLAKALVAINSKVKKIVNDLNIVYVLRNNITEDGSKIYEGIEKQFNKFSNRQQVYRQARAALSEYKNAVIKANNIEDIQKLFTNMRRAVNESLGVFQSPDAVAINNISFMLDVNKDLRGLSVYKQTYEGIIKRLTTEIDKAENLLSDYQNLLNGSGAAIKLKENYDLIAKKLAAGTEEGHNILNDTAAKAGSDVKQVQVLTQEFAGKKVTISEGTTVKSLRTPGTEDVLIKDVGIKKIVTIETPEQAKEAFGLMFVDKIKKIDGVDTTEASPFTKLLNSITEAYPVVEVPERVLESIENLKEFMDFINTKGIDVFTDEQIFKEFINLIEDSQGAMFKLDEVAKLYDKEMSVHLLKDNLKPVWDTTVDGTIKMTKPPMMASLPFMTTTKMVYPTEVIKELWKDTPKGRVHLDSVYTDLLRNLNRDADEFRDLIECYNIYDTRANLLKTDAVNIQYGFKLENTYPLINSHADATGITGLVKELSNVDSMARKELREFAKSDNSDIAKAAIELENFIQSFELTGNFLDTLYSDPTLADGIRTHFISALMRNKNAYNGHIISNAEYMADSVIKSLRDFLAAEKSTRAYNMESLTKETQALLQRDPKVKLRYEDFSKTEKARLQHFFEVGETHTAGDDTELLEYILRLRYYDDYVSKVNPYGDGFLYYDKYDRILTSADGETNGLKAASSIQQELAIKVWGQPAKEFRLAMSDPNPNVWKYPKPEVIQGKFKGMSEAQATKAYQEFYNPNSATNIKLVAEGKLQFFNTEGEMFTEYHKQLNGMSHPHTVIMHNGKDFDVPMMQTRARESANIFLGAEGSNYSVVDSLVDMRATEYGLTLDSMTEIKLRNYITMLVKQLPEGVNAFLHPVSMNNVIKIDEFLHLIRNPGTPGVNLNPIKTASPLSSLEGILNNLKDTIDNAVKANDGIIENMNSIVLDKDFWASSEAADTMVKLAKNKIEDIAEILNRLPETDPNYKYFTDMRNMLEQTVELARHGYVNVNSSRFNYLFGMDTVPMFGIRKIYDPVLVNNYFNLKGAELGIKLNNRPTFGSVAQDYHDFAEIVNKSYDSIKNTTLLDGKTTLMQNSIEIMKEVLSKYSGIYKVIRSDNLDARSNYLMLHKLLWDIDKFDTSWLNKLSVEQQKVIIEVNELFTKQARETTFKNDIDNWTMYSQGELINRYEDFTLDSVDIPVKDFETLTKGVESFTTLKQFSDNMGVFANTAKMRISALAVPLHRAIEGFTTHLKSLEPHFQERLIRDVQAATDKHSFRALEQILNISNPKDLLNLLCFKSMTIMFDNRSLQTNPYLLQKFYAREKELAAAGIRIYRDTHLGTTILYPDRSVVAKAMVDPRTNRTMYELNGESVIPYNLDEIDIAEDLKFLPEDLQLKFKEAQSSLDRCANGTGVGSNYDAVDKNFYRDMFDKLPDEVKKNILPKEFFLDDALFNRTTRFNFSTLGSYNFNKGYNTFTSSDFIKNYANTFTKTSMRATEKMNYVEFAFSDCFSINYGVTKDLNFEDMSRMLQDAPEFKLSIMTTNDKGKLQLVDLKLNTEADLEFARKNNARVLPYHVHSKIFSTVNSELYEDMEPSVKFITKLMHHYKIGYLASEGYVLRNIIDTFGKNIIISDGDIPQAVMSTIKSWKLYYNYNAALEEIRKLDTFHKINKNSIEEYFTNYRGTRLTKEEFAYAHEVLNSGALVGEVKAMQNYRAINKAKKDLTEEELLDFNDAKATQQSLFGLLFDVNNDIENVQRLAAYDMLHNKGLNFTEAVARVGTEHFNYDTKTARQKFMELIFPFYTFKINNLHYWAEAVENNGWVAGLMRDAFTPIWDFDDITPYEMENNKSLQYRLLSGNIQLSDSGLTFKANPSVMDAFQLITDPLASIHNAEFAPLQFLTETAIKGATQAMGNNIGAYAEDAFNFYDKQNPTMLDAIQDNINYLPYGAIAQRYISGLNNAKSTGNVLPMITPSIFGKTSRFDPYIPKTYAKKQYSSKGYTKKPKRQYGKRQYSDKNYFTKFQSTYATGLHDDRPYFNSYRPEHGVRYNFRDVPTTTQYDRLYTSKGKSRFDLMMMPVNSRNLKYKIKRMVHYK